MAPLPLLCFTWAAMTPPHASMCSQTKVVAPSPASLNAGGYSVTRARLTSSRFFSPGGSV
jgi:hypothetical protein